MNLYPTNYAQQGGNFANPYAQQYQQQQAQLQQLQAQQQQFQNPQQQIQQPLQQIQQEMLKGKRVSTLEEAKASTIEFDGSTFYFPSVDGKSIYTKQVGLDGNVAVLEYKLIANITENKEENKTQTIDYMGVIEKQNSIIDSLNDRVINLENERNKIKDLENKTESLLKELGGK